MGVETVNFRVEPTGLRGYWNQCVQSAKRPVEWIRALASPTENPGITLRRINDAASRGLEKARNAGIQFESRSPQINNELNHALQRQGVGQQVRTRPEIGAVADLSPYQNNPEVTRALQLQDRVDRTDWSSRRDESLRKLIDKVSVFTSLLQMRNWAGITEANNLKIMSLVKQVTDNPNPVSVWDVFVNNYDQQLGFFGKIFAGFFYWFFHMTGLINNTVDAYLGGFVEDITKDLTANSNETRTKLFRRLIEETNDFCVEDVRATRAYAHGLERGKNLEKLQDEAIERHYGFNLDALCENFSSYMVAGDPRVHFFKDLHEVPVLGYLVRIFEWVVNKLIVQRLMMNSILPSVLKQGVTNGVEATQPDKLPFAIAMTKFFTSQLESLRTLIENTEMDSGSEEENIPGTESLPSMIRNLFEVLHYENDEENSSTPLELRKKIAQFERGGIIDEKLFGEVKSGLIRAGNSLFKLLDKTAKSGELFAKLTELSMAPFAGQEKTEEMLRAEYEEEKANFLTTGTSVFQLLLHKSISKALPGATSAAESERELSLAKESLAKQSIVVNELIVKMAEVAERMKENIGLLETNPTQETTLQSDIAEFFELMKILNSRKEFQDNLDKIDGTHKNEIWRRFNPLFDKIEAVQTRVLELQDLSDQYPRHAQVAIELGQMRALFTTMQDQFLQTPIRYPQATTIVQSLRRSAEEIARSLGANAPIPDRLREAVQDTSKYSTNIAKEQNAIDAVHALFGPSGNGLLDEMRAHRRGDSPRGFDPRGCLNRIEQHLSYFNDDERREAARLIGDGNHVGDRWEQIQALLQNILNHHIEIRDRESNSLRTLLNTTIGWLDDRVFEYNHVRSGDHQKMRRHMTKISSEMGIITAEGRAISPSLTIPLSSKIMKAFSLGVPAVGVVLGYPATAGFLGIGSFRLMQTPSSATEEHWLLSVVKKGVGVGASAVLSSYVPTWASNWLPGWENAAAAASYAATGAFAGKSAVDLALTGSQKYTFKKVWNIFIKAYKLSLKKRIYKGAATRAMAAVTNLS